MVSRRIEKLLRGGVNAALVEVEAEVCQRCGEQRFTSSTIRRFEEIRDKLARQDTADFLPIGRTFQAPQPA